MGTNFSLLVTLFLVDTFLRVDDCAVDELTRNNPQS